MCAFQRKCAHFHHRCTLPARVTFIGLSFERPYLIKGLNFMIPTFVDFAAEICSFHQIHGFPSKTTVFSQNHRFQGSESMIFMKTAVFSQKLWILQFLSLKLENSLLVFSLERGSKG